jgi:NADH-quinone oxidoreductase subunit M
MNELHFPWIEAAILLPLLGAAWVVRLRDPVKAHRHSLSFTTLTFLAAILASQDFYSLHIFRAEDAWHLMSRVLGRELFAIDELNAPFRDVTDGSVDTGALQCRRTVDHYSGTRRRNGSRLF